MCVGLSLGMSTPRIRGMAHLVLSALALLVPGVAANDQQLAVPAYQLAVLADPFDARPNLHDFAPPTGSGATGKTITTRPRFAPVRRTAVACVGSPDEGSGKFFF